MATESAPSRPRGKRNAKSKLVGFEEFIQEQFGKTRGALRSVDILLALAQWFTAALVFFFAVVMLDHWIIPGGMAPWMRWTALATLLLGSMAYLGYAAGIPLTRRISLPFAAQTIERSDPSLKNSLINFLDLRRRKNQLSPAVLELVEQQAATDLTRVEVENAVSREGLVKTSYAMLVMVVLGCAYVLLSPKSPFATLGRVLAPAADISPPTKVTIAEVQPGDGRVFAGDELDITAATGISDGITPDHVSLYYTTESRKYVDEPLDMVPMPDRPRQWRATLRGDSSRSAGLQESFTYRIEAGDFTTRDYRIEVVQAPSARVEQVVYDFPEYTGFEQRVLNVGDVDALEGTTVTVTATTNTPAKHGGIDFDGDLKSDLMMTRQDDAEKNGDRLEGSFVLGFKPDGTPRYESYQVLFETADGETNPNPIHYRIQTRRDYPPTVSIPQPGRDVSWPANTSLPLRIEAEDKDFALRRVVLHVTQGRQNLIDQNVGPHTGLGRTLSAEHTLDLAKLGLEAGDVIQYWAEALDNKQPQANRAESTRYEVRILSPVPPDKQEQLIASAREEIEQRQQEIEEAQPDEDGTPQAETETQDASQSEEGDDEGSEMESDAEAIAKILEKRRQEQEEKGGEEPAKPSESDSPDDSQTQQQSTSGSDRQQAAGSEKQPSEQSDDGSSDPQGNEQNQKDSPSLPSGIGKPTDQTKPGDGSEGSEEGGTSQSGERGSQNQQPDASTGGNQPTENNNDSRAKDGSGTEGDMPGEKPSQATPKPGHSDQPGTESTQQDNSQQPSDSTGSEKGSGSDPPQNSDSQQTGKGEGSTDSGTPKPGAETEQPAKPGTEKPENAIPQASDASGEQGDSATPEPPKEPDPQSAAPEKDRSNKQGKDSGTAPEAGKPSPGQQAPQPGTGQDGSQSDGQKGGQPSDQPGSSEATRPGQQSPSDQPTGQSGSTQQPAGSAETDENAKNQSTPDETKTSEPQTEKQPGDESGQPSKGSESGDSSQDASKSEQPGSPSDAAQPSEPTSPQGSPPSDQNEQPGSGEGQSPSPRSGNSAGGQNQQGSGKPNSGGGNQQGDRSSDSASRTGGAGGPGKANQTPGAADNTPEVPDPANEDYARIPSELVLDYLRNHKKQDEIDPELAKELGRTPEQLKKLMERLEQYQDAASKATGDLSPEEAARLRAFEESVRRQQLERATFERGTTGTPKDPRAVFVGERRDVPAEYKDRYDAYRRSVLSEGKPTSK